MKRLSERKVTERLRRLLERHIKGAKTFTFKQAGILTTDSGLVVKLHSGRKFYLTVQTD